MAPKTGFITGTGFYTLPGVMDVRAQSVDTPFGPVNVELASLAGQEIVFIPRHGKSHTVSPQMINHRGNLFALKLLGVERILATSVSGSLVPAWGPGTLVLIDQFINFTYGRPDTFYPMEGVLAHVDVTEPYCSTLRTWLAESGERLGVPLQKSATYACTNGPRFESRGEIEMIRRLGGHLVGQTNYPECILARELAICYTSVGVVSNFAAGMSIRVTAREVTQNIKDLGLSIANLFADLLAHHPIPEDCTCRHALDEAELN
jgi:5'-methylthioadenosine phosphorylase